MNLLSIKYGTRYACYQCGAAFFDLNREKALCPRCGADQTERPKIEDRLTTRATKKEAPISKLDDDLDSIDDDDDDSLIDDMDDEDMNSPDFDDEEKDDEN